MSMVDAFMTYTRMSVMFSHHLEGFHHLMGMRCLTTAHVLRLQPAAQHT